MVDRRGRTSIRAAAPFLVIALVLGACSSTPSPSVAPPTASVVTTAPSTAASLGSPFVPPTATAPPAETVAAGPAQCEPADLKASHGRVEGAAGSIFTTVVLSPAFTCSVDLFPAFGLRDVNGAVLVGGAAAGSGRLDLDPELSYETNVRLANWCADEPAFPLRFELILGGATEEVTGGSFPEEGDVPPCNGETAGRILEAGAWEAAAP